MAATRQTVEPKHIKLVARKPHKVRTALESWIKASEIMDSDPLNLNGAPDWVEKAWAEVIKVIMPSRQLPTSGEWDLELIGELFGRLQAFAKLYSGEIPMSPDVKKEYDRIKAHVAAQPKSPGETARKKAVANDLQGKIIALQSSLPDMLKAALSSSHEDAIKFQNGLLRGMNLEQDELLTPNTFQRHTKIFWVLAAQWRRWVECGSAMEVHRILCAELGEKEVGSLKTFQNRIAKPIGFKLSQRGRPKKLR